VNTPFIFSSEYAHTYFVCRFCNDNGPAAIKYLWWFPHQGIPDWCSVMFISDLFQSVLSTAENPVQQNVDGEETLLTWHSAVHVLIPEEFLPTFMFCMWQSGKHLHCESLYLYHIQGILQHLEPGDRGRPLKFCCWFDVHYHLHHYILFTIRAQFTPSRVRNTRNSHLWTYDNPHGTVESNFHHFYVNV